MRALHDEGDLAAGLGRGRGRVRRLTTSTSRQKIRDQLKRFNNDRSELYTDRRVQRRVGHLSRAEAFAWCAEQQLAAIEMGVGGWAKAAHQLPLDRLLRAW